LSPPILRRAAVLAAVLGPLAACGGLPSFGPEGGGRCLPVDEAIRAAHGDRDLARNAARLADPRFCVRVATVADGADRWTLVGITDTSRAGPLWVVPHDDEDAGFDAALGGLARYGGTLVAVEAREQRMQRGRDPNRIFGSGVCGRGGPAAPAYTRAMLAARDRRFPIVAVHTNEPHGGTVSMRAPFAGATAFPATAAPAAGPRRDDDTLVILAGPRPPADDDAARGTIAWFNTRGANVLYETVGGRGDCSLSNHAVLSGLGRTYTVEAADGDERSASALVDLVMQHAGVGAR